MKILSWNCNGAFRKKFEFIKNDDIDVYVIQECENPISSNHDKYQLFAKNSIWIGENKNKGLGIFAKEDALLSQNNWKLFCLKYFTS